MKKRLAICDSDERYCNGMQNYLMKRLTDFEIYVFRSLRDVAEYSKKQAFEILLIGEHIYEKDLSGIQALQIIVLRENGEKRITEYPYLEKYQSMETMIQEMFQEYAGHILMDTSVYQCKKKTKLHVFYSPVGQKAQTKAAIVLGQILVERNHKVLYLNLQAFTGIQELLGDENFADITDLLYVAERQESNLFFRVQGMKQSCGGVDYFAPAADFMDLLSVSEKEWMEFLQKMIEGGEYTDIILDLSEICQGLYGMLEKSDDIYSICSTTREEQHAVEQYKKLLAKRELSYVLEKTKWVDLQQECMERVISIERLAMTPIGEYMKGLVQENGNRPI